MINKFTKVAGFIQKSVAFLYTNNEITEKVKKKKTNKQTKKKTRNKPNKGVNILQTENYKTLTKGDEDDSKKWKYISCS